LPKSFLIRLLNEITDDELNELARDVAKNDLIDICLFLHGEFDIASVSKIAEVWLRMARMPHRIEVDADIHQIIITTDIPWKFNHSMSEADLHQRLDNFIQSG
jgi:hypothetical protein